MAPGEESMENSKAVSHGTGKCRHKPKLEPILSFAFQVVLVAFRVLC